MALLGACRPSKTPATRTNVATQDTLLDHESFSLNSTILGEARTIAVYLPPQYAASPHRNFPVLYMPDGGIKEDFPHVSFTIDKLIKQKTIEPMLVVGVGNIDRYKDLTSPTQVRKEKKRVPDAGGARNFHAFFEQELKAAIAQRYRVEDQRTAIVGESLAGRWIVEGWLQQPGRYDVWIAIDPTLWWNDRELIKLAERTLLGPNARTSTHLYISGAYRDKKGNLAEVNAFAKVLRASGLPDSQWTLESYPEYEHTHIFRRSETQVFRTMLGR